MSTETISATYTSTPLALLGVWALDPTTPDASDTNFLYADATSRGEDIDPGAQVIVLNGRANPMVDYGQSLRVDLKVTILVPFGTAHDSQVSYWRNVAKAKRTILYRDGRGRLIYLALSDKLVISDRRDGTAIGVAGVQVDYAPLVV